MFLYNKSIFILIVPQPKLPPLAYTCAWGTCTPPLPPFTHGFIPSLALKTLLYACIHTHRCHYSAYKAPQIHKTMNS